MTNREAMEIVLKMAEAYSKPMTDKEREQYPKAIYQMQDYMNDLMRDEKDHDWTY